MRTIIIAVVAATAEMHRCVLAERRRFEERFDRAMDHFGSRGRELQRQSEPRAVPTHRVIVEDAY